ncbi:unnamed protein product [marine sediment metagenome]|uniref:Uncharacterized protein n=1 Tax=marine sediment metagenome TaxID=412755 RepID=X1N8Y7_9ZZZZ
MSPTRVILVEIIAMMLYLLKFLEYNSTFEFGCCTKFFNQPFPTMGLKFGKL